MHIGDPIDRFWSKRPGRPSSAIVKTAISLLSWLATSRPLARGIDGEVARRAAAARFEADRSEVAGFGLEREGRDAIVASVRRVDEPSVRMEQDVRTMIAGDGAVRQSLGARHRKKDTAFGVHTQGGDGGVEFPDNGRPATARMECELARPRAGRQRQDGPGSRRQQARMTKAVGEVASRPRSASIAKRPSGLTRTQWG